MERGPEMEEAVKVTDLVIYGPSLRKLIGTGFAIPPTDDGDHPLVGVREFHIAQALLDGRVEMLSQKVPSQSGPVHLFDACMSYGHEDIAWALASCGVEGCELQVDYLRGLYETDWWRRSDPGNDPWADPARQACICWGFPEDQGTWMPDWHEDLKDAVAGAHSVVSKPWVRTLLDMVALDKELPLAVSPAAMARLLDVSILIGEVKAAQVLAKRCQVFPLRRWRSDDFFCRPPRRTVLSRWSLTVRYPGVLKAALSAGVNIQELRCWTLGRSCREPAPFGDVLFLCSTSLWMECANFLPPKPWRSRSQSLEGQEAKLDLISFFLVDQDALCIDMEKLRQCKGTGMDLKQLTIACKWNDEQIFYSLNFLDFAILLGQSDAAEFCAAVELEVTAEGGNFYSQVLSRGNGELLLEQIPRVRDRSMSKSGSPTACRLAATSAGQAALRLAYNRHAKEHGFVIYQVLAKKAFPKSFPLWLVREVLAFSVLAPKLIEQLDLWEEVDGWSATTPIVADPAVKLQVHQADREDPGIAVEEGDTEAERQGAATAPAVLDDKGTDDLLQALQASREHVPPLSMDGVCIWRLTRQSKCVEVNAVLLDPTGPLAKIHQRVLDAGCQVNPEGNPLKALFVPCTEQQLVELQALGAQGYELCREQHLLALEEDGPVIDEALRSCVSKKNRGKLKKLCPKSMVGVPSVPESQHTAQSSTDVARGHQADEEEDETVNEPMLVREYGLRTDSSLGYPSYQVQ